MIKSSDKTHIEWLDGLKGISIILIILYHWFYYFNSNLILQKISKFGGQGAHLFIILSGFGLYFSAHTNKINIDIKWLLSRFSKILKPYYLSLILTVFWIFIVHYFFQSKNILELLTINLQSLLANIFLYRFFLQEYYFSINPSWWFIGTIIQLYCLFPILYYLIKKFGSRTTLVLTFMVTLVWQWYYSFILKTTSDVYSRFSLSFLFEFTFGIIICRLFILNNPRFYKLFFGYIPLTLGLLLETISYYITYYLSFASSFNDILNGIGFFLICFNIYQLIKIVNIKNLFVEFGRKSLGVFLLHQPFILILYISFDDLSFVLRNILLSFFIIFCFLLGYFFNKLLINKK